MYRVLLELVTQVNGANNDGGTTATNSTYRRNSMDLEYLSTKQEVGSSSLSGGARQWCP